jgi:hypothetical protein
VVRSPVVKQNDKHGPPARRRPEPDADPRPRLDHRRLQRIGRTYRRLLYAYRSGAEAHIRLINRPAGPCWIRNIIGRCIRRAPV